MSNNKSALWATVPKLDDNSNLSQGGIELSLSAQPMAAKTFHCRIHDQVRMPAPLVAVIDTPQFQRLRDLKQLGFSDLVFPGGTHTRFEHSIGVAHLAMTMLRQIIANHAETGTPLDVSQKDTICVGLAGLCHDLGHGPASHMFENFVNAARAKRGVAQKWHHEDASLKLFDYLIEANGLNMAAYSLEPEDLCFVKRLIEGLKPTEPFPTDIGRPRSKRFLFDIVANKRNGIDVDKMDYFMRDSIACFGHMPDVQVTRLVNCARVIECDGQTQICYEEKVALTLAALFNLRAKLHKFVYQHRMTRLIEQMAQDALLLAEEGGFGMSVPDEASGNPDGDRKVLLSDVVDDMESYTMCSDWIFRQLLASTSAELAPARNLLRAVQRRQMYHLVGCCEVAATPDPDEILAHLPPQYRDADELMAKARASLVLSTAVIKYGSSDMKGGDPIQNVRFFNPKKSLTRTTRVQPGQISKLFTPREYQEVTLFAYTRDEQFETALSRAFLAWTDTNRGSDRGVKDHYPFVNASPRLFRSPMGTRLSATPAQPGSIPAFPGDEEEQDLIPRASSARLSQQPAKLATPQQPSRGSAALSPP